MAISNSPELRPDLCIVGAGAAGLSVAAGAAQLGAEVVLIEAGTMGGDCLNVGCVPSKAMLAAGAALKEARNGEVFGVVPGNAARIDATALRAHVRGVIDGIAPHDSQERFEGLGVTVIRDWARFVDADTLEVGGQKIRPRRFVLATGSKPRVPDLPGLKDVPYLTNETLFDLEAVPEHLIILGGGPIGCEMAQAHRRLDSKVTLLEADEILARDDRVLAAMIRERLVEEGVELREHARASGFNATSTGVRVELEGGGFVEGSHLLVAIGRQPNSDKLELERAGIETTPAGITVDRRLRTTNRRAFAMGDAVPGPQFTHVASHHASVVVQNALFRIPAKVTDIIPHVTYTDPELAQLGRRIDELDGEPGIEVVDVPFEQADRARTDRRTDGRLRLAADKRGRIKGVGIVGPHAGELLQPWVLMMQQKIGLRALTSAVVPYPTLGEINKRAASAFFAPKIFNSRTKRLVRWLAKLG